MSAPPLASGCCSPLDYRAVRRRYCLAALRAFARKWIAYLAVGAGLAGVGAPALAAGSVLPLFWSLAHPVWIGPVLLAYVGGAALMLWFARQLLWPTAWAQAERALPIPRWQMLASDAEVVVVALAPLALLLAAGAAVLFVEDADWLRPHKSAALLALLSCLAASIAAVMAGLQWLRHGAACGIAADRRPRRAGAVASEIAIPRPQVVGLFVSALCHGVSPRALRAIAAGGTGLVVLAVVAGLRSAEAAWWMAGFALLSLAVVSRVNALARHEFEPLLAQCRNLPLSAPALAWARDSLSLVPVLVGVVALLAVSTWLDLRPRVFFCFVFVCCVACLVEARSSTQEPANKIARWLFSVALAVALASEAVV
jgi:hypothetical protein